MSQWFVPVHKTAIYFAKFTYIFTWPSAISHIKKFLTCLKLKPGHIFGVINKYCKCQMSQTLHRSACARHSVRMSNWIRTVCSWQIYLRHMVLCALTCFLFTDHSCCVCSSTHNCISIGTGKLYCDFKFTWRINDILN